ncbi:MAG: MFS transporter [Nitrososphaerota archaeon]|nr:MFS transporter [Nitrososphaerota archaeon]
MNSVKGIFVAKAARVFVFGLVSVVTPVYMAVLGFPPLLVGVEIAAMVSGSAVSNVILIRYEGRVGRRRFLLLCSLLMLCSGALLFSTSSYPIILLASFIGNVSTSGTEAGPFQSIETGVLPTLGPLETVNKTFGMYNMIGYGASSLGALAATVPSYFHDDLLVFRSLYLLYGLVGLVLVVVYWGIGGLRSRRSEAETPAANRRSSGARREIIRLSGLQAIDAFGGGFVSQSLLAYWFFLVYGVTLGGLGVIFLVVNVITALSTLGASYLADRIGNLRTMVYTHLLSNAFLVLIPFAGSLAGALFFLFARQSVSQMDVPTRQAFTAGIFADEERVRANATTNTSRVIANVFGSPLSGALLGAGLVSLPLLIAGFSKVFYDSLMFFTYRRRAR